MKKILMSLIVMSLISVTAVPVFALTEEESGTTNLQYEVEENYTWQIHGEIDFGKNAGAGTTVDKEGKIGSETLGVKVTENVISDGKKLSICIDSNQKFTIINSKNVSLNYAVSKTSGGAVLSAGEEVLAVNAGTNEGSQALYFKLTTQSGTEQAGKYTGNITYTASVVNQ